VHEAHLAALAEAEKTLKEACVGVEDEELREVKS
jgi:glycerol-3-phosphate cytidylyltransferase-like family protein